MLAIANKSQHIWVLKIISLPLKPIVNAENGIYPRNSHRILPIVLYHGKSVWTLPKFEDLFGHLPEILKRFLPDFDIIVIDLAKYSD
jgi:Putative transposase, YhgA-like